MKIKRIVHLLLIFAAFCSAAFAQSEKNADASFYETKIEFSKGEIDSGLSTELFLKILLTRAGATAGIVWAEDEKIYEKFELRPQVLTFKEWLAFFVKTKPTYRWKEINGVINIFPAKSYSILDTRIPEFRAANQFPGELANKLAETREFQQYIRKRQTTSRLSDLDEPYGLRSERFERSLESLPKISFEFKNATFREILNEIVRRAGKRFWFYYEYKTDENYHTYQLRIL